ncbi:hypothetical protein KGF57_002264 [Candida theae]|uniref:Uncharacterized protein n=1 Tax=Candida theae TaxID=1198502 RepID=A0AAD5BF69_9ASCO|nr:uncharacterized protein KGF57_002264 [Candida theae]KAI5958830.1 hypothetical protein KGF57_002264 [Candida theae]
MKYRNRTEAGPDPMIQYNNTANESDLLRYKLSPDQLRRLREPRWRSCSEPVTGTITTTTTPTATQYIQRPFTADNEITHISDSEDDSELPPLSATSQSTFQTKLNSVLPTFTMEDDYFDYDGNGTVQSQLSNENFHSVDFASNDDEENCAMGSAGRASDAVRRGGCSTSRKAGPLLSGEAETVENADHDDDEDVILIGSSQVVAANSSSSFNTEMERNIDFEEENEATEELDKTQLLKDLADTRILSPIHEQKFDPSEIERCSTPLVDDKKLVKSECESDAYAIKTESVSCLGGEYVKKELESCVNVKSEPDGVDSKQITKSNVARIKKEFLNDAATLKKEKLIKPSPTFEVKREEEEPKVVKERESQVLDPTNRAGKEGKGKPNHNSAPLQDEVNFSGGQENKQPAPNRTLKRKRIPSKPLSAIVNTKTRRVGLSKIKEHLHERIKKKA